MDVSNLPENERIELFNKWLTNRSSGEFNFGNEINFTKSQLSDPNYIIPEWGCKLPKWVFSRRLSEMIGRKCSTGTPGGEYTDSGIRGTFIGLQATYEDFYYIIKLDVSIFNHKPGEIIYDTCVNGIKFYTDEEYEIEFHDDKWKGKSYRIVESNNEFAR